jgi:uncharacterized Zn finger protein
MALVWLSWAVAERDPGRADALLDRAVAPLQAERGHPARSLLLLQLAVQLAELGDVRWSRLVDTPEDVSLIPLVAALADAGNIQEALRAARTEVSQPDAALDAVALSLITRSEHDEALAVAREMRDQEARESLELAIADSLADVGRLRDAIGVAAGANTEALLSGYIRWAPWWERESPGSFNRVLEAATSAASWYDVRWNSVHSVLAGRA